MYTKLYIYSSKDHSTDLQIKSDSKTNFIADRKIHNTKPN